MTPAFYMHTPRFRIAIALGRWRIGWQRRSRTGWWVRQRARIVLDSPAAPHGGLGDVLRGGPALYGFAEGFWRWEDLLTYVQHIWGPDVTPQVLHHRLKALGYTSDGQHVMPKMKQGAPNLRACDDTDQGKPYFAYLP